MSDQHTQKGAAGGAAGSSSNIPPPSAIKKPSSSGIPSAIPSRLPTTATATSSASSGIATGIKRPSATTTTTSSSNLGGQTSQTSSTSSIGGGQVTDNQAAVDTTTPKPVSRIASMSGLVKNPSTTPTSQQLQQSAAAAKATPTQPHTPSQIAAAATTESATSSGNSSTIDDKEKEALRNQIKDLNEKLETLKLKRAEDRDKLREYEKSKMQIQQLLEFKTQAQEKMSDLNRELQKAQDEAKEAKEQFISYKDEMSNHEQRIEEMTVDKELAEARLEELQDEVARLNDKNEELKLELEVLKGEIELNGSSGAAESFQSKQMEKEIERLKQALIKLRDMNVQDKSDIAAVKKQNEELAGKVKSLSKENEMLKEEANSHKFQINELKDQVQATLGSVQMIEQLTEQNLDLEAKLIELKDAIADLEAINEVNDQLQESAREEEKELRQTLDISQNRVREAERQIEALKYSLADQDNTISKFRELVKKLQNENDKLNRKMQTKLDDDRALTSMNQSVNQYDFKQKFYETKTFAKEVENELSKIEIQNQKSYVNYLLSFMSEQFLRKSNDHECLLSLLFFKRLANKADLLLNLISKKNTDSAAASAAADPNDSANQSLSLTTTLQQTNEASGLVVEKQAFLSELFILLSNIKLICNRFEYVLNTCDSKCFYSVGALYYDYNLYEKNLDVFFELLQKDQLDESISLELLEKACLHLQTLYKNYLDQNEINGSSFVQDTAKYLKNCSESISIDLKRINATLTNKDETSEIMILLKDVGNFNENIKQLTKKIQKSLPKFDDVDQHQQQQQTAATANSSNGGGAAVNSGVIVMMSGDVGRKRKLKMPDEIRKQLESCIDDYFRLSKVLREIYNMASNLTISLDSNGSNNFVGGSSSSASAIDADRVLTAKKLENLAFQACDKVYTKEDNGPYDNIRSSINNVEKVLINVQSSLANGDFEVEISDEEFKAQKFYINAPIVFASENYKKSLFEAENLKYKLESKEDEIKELKKHLKLKIDELSEHKVRIGLSEKKTELAFKEMEEKDKKHLQVVDELKAAILKKEKEQAETMEVLTQEIDTLQNERKDLKEKLRQQTKKHLFDNIMSRQTSSVSNSSAVTGITPTNEDASGSGIGKGIFMGEAPTALIQELKLMRSLNKLLMNTNQEIKKSMTLNYLDNNSKINQTKKYVAAINSSADKTTAALNRNSNTLLKELYDSLVNVQVPVLNQSSQMRNERTIKSFKENNQQLNNKLCLILKETDNIKTSLHHLRGSLPLPTGGKGQREPFKRVDQNKQASLNAAANDSSSTKLLMAEIRIPVLASGPQKNSSSSSSSFSKSNVINISLKSKEIKDILKCI